MVENRSHTSAITADDARLATAAATLKMLAEKTRLHILWILTTAPADVNSLTRATGASRTAVSQHLAKLRLAGLVDAHREDRHVIYSLRDGHLSRLVAESLSHADHIATGEPLHPPETHGEPARRGAHRPTA